MYVLFYVEFFFAFIGLEQALHHEFSNVPYLYVRLAGFHLISLRVCCFATLMRIALEKGEERCRQQLL